MAYNETMRRWAVLAGTALGLVGVALVARTVLERGGRSAAPITTSQAAELQDRRAPETALVAPGPVAEREHRAAADPTTALTGDVLEPAGGPRALRRPDESAETIETTSISGRVSTPSGLGLADVMVSAAPDSRRKAHKVWTRTNVDGHFEFEVPQRFDLVYRVQVGGSTEDRVLRRLIQSLKGQGELRVDDVVPGRDDIDFVIPVPGSVSLIAVDRVTGVGLVGLTIESRLPSEPDFHPHGWGLQRMPPDDQGRFTVGLPAGPIVLRLSDPGYAPVERPFDVPPTREPLPVVVEFDPCARLELNVVMKPGTLPGEYNSQLGNIVPRDDFGQPAYKASVMLLTDDEHERFSAATRREVDDVWLKELSARVRRESRLFEDEDGTRVAWPPPGRYHLAAFPRQSQFEPATIEVGQVDRAVTVEVRPLGRRRD